MISEREIPEEERPADQFPIIIDAGSWVKADFASAEIDIPRYLIPTIIATEPEDVNSIEEETAYVGFDAMHQSSKSASLDFRFPIECGLPIIKEDAELIYQYTFDQLKVDSRDQSVVMGRKSLFPNNFSAQIGESMFEKFQIKNFEFINTDITTMWMTGRSSGVLVDMGTSQIMIVPIIEGCPQMHAIKRIELGGRDITETLQKLIEKNTNGMYKFRTANEINIIRQLKEKSCKIVSKWDNATTKEVFQKNQRRYELPDGEEITLGCERVEAPELLFNPEVAGLSVESNLPKQIHAAIRECDILQRRSLFKNIILTGGTSMITGLSERLGAELRALLSPSVEICIITDFCDINRKYCAWTSMNFYAGVGSSNEKKTCISREKYEEYGSNIFYRKSY